MFCNFALQKHGKEQQQALAAPLSLTADKCNQLQGDIQTNNSVQSVYNTQTEMPSQRYSSQKQA